MISSTSPQPPPLPPLSFYWWTFFIKFCLSYHLCNHLHITYKFKVLILLSSKQEIKNHCCLDLFTLLYVLLIIGLDCHLTEPRLLCSAHCWKEGAWPSFYRRPPPKRVASPRPPAWSVSKHLLCQIFAGSRAPGRWVGWASRPTLTEAGVGARPSLSHPPLDPHPPPLGGCWCPLAAETVGGGHPGLQPCTWPLLGPTEAPTHLF